MSSGFYTAEDYKTWKAEEDRLGTIISELQEENTTARDLLCRLEWCDETDVGEGGDCDSCESCLLCYALKGTAHHKDCALGAFLNPSEEAPAPTITSPPEFSAAQLWEKIKATIYGPTHAGKITQAQIDYDITKLIAEHLQAVEGEAKA